MGTKVLARRVRTSRDALTHPDFGSSFTSIAIGRGRKRGHAFKQNMNSMHGLYEKQFLDVSCP